MQAYLLRGRWPITFLLGASAFFVANVPLRPELWGVSVAAIGLFALPVLFGTVQWLGRRRGWLIIAALGLYALAFETLAVTTGFPYGSFSYSDILGPKLLNIVPFPVFIAWTPLILGALALTQPLTRRRRSQAVIATLTLVAIDLVLDPAAVQLGFWGWDTPGMYYGVPLVNFGGWLLSGGIAIIATLVAMRRWKTPDMPRLLTLNLWYILTFWTAINLWSIQLIPVLIGCGLLVMTHRRLRHHE